MQTTTSHKLFEEFITNSEGLKCYMAGLPGYPRNFSRDTILSGIIAADQQLLESQVMMSCTHQGQQDNPITGEEPGKIHHEYPGVVVNAPYVSTYDACDTTALYLIGLEVLWSLKKVESIKFLNHYKHSIEKSVGYIQRHIKGDIFWEFPPPGVKHFSLFTTYWKDSIVADPNRGLEPIYPVAYGLVQFQVARGLLAAANMLKRDSLKIQADQLFKKAINEFMTEQCFCIMQDKRGRLEQVSSDELHALAYIPREYTSLIPKDAIYHRTQELISTVGIACTPRAVSIKLADQYHGYVVWMFEQALIHYGCQKFGFNEIAKVTQRCVPYIGDGQELVSIEPAIKPLGNDRQLWSVAAKIYFSNLHSLRRVDWL